MKKLILRYISAGTGSVSFKIEEQSHRNNEFGSGSSFFESTGNISLDSVANPAISYSTDVLYCRGHERESDNNIIKVSPSIWEKIKVAVKEYNECFGNYGECILNDPDGVIENIVPIEMFVID